MINDESCKVLKINHLQKLFFSIKIQFNSKIKINAVICKRWVGGLVNGNFKEYRFFFEKKICIL
jgi:hypothetical protein